MKKPFNKNKRLRIYKQMLIDIKEAEERRRKWKWNCPTGFCLVLGYQGVENIEDIQFFPELMKYKPKNLANSYWFEYKKINPRIKILKTIIKEMEGEAKKK